MIFARENSITDFGREAKISYFRDISWLINPILLNAFLLFIFVDNVEKDIFWLEISVNKIPVVHLAQALQNILDNRGHSILVHDLQRRVQCRSGLNRCGWAKTGGVSRCAALRRILRVVGRLFD